jgi:hypothetical protein
MAAERAMTANEYAQSAALMRVAADWAMEKKDYCLLIVPLVRTSLKRRAAFLTCRALALASASRREPIDQRIAEHFQPIRLQMRVLHRIDSPKACHSGQEKSIPPSSDSLQSKFIIKPSLRANF